MEIPTILCFLLSLPFWPALAPRGVNVSQWMTDLRYDWFMAESVIRSSCDVEGAEEHLPSYHSPGTTVLKDRNFQTKWMDSVNIRFFLEQGRSWNSSILLIFFLSFCSVLWAWLCTSWAWVKNLYYVSTEPYINHEISHTTIYQTSPRIPFGEYNRVSLCFVSIPWPSCTLRRIRSHCIDMSAQVGWGLLEKDYVDLHNVYYGDKVLVMVDEHTRLCTWVCR